MKRAPRNISLSSLDVFKKLIPSTVYAAVCRIQILAQPSVLWFMSQVQGLPELPYLAAGIGPRMLGLIREAGVPIARFDQVNSGLLAKFQGRLMLFDSQTDAGRDGFRRASRYGLPAIDVAQHARALSEQDRSELGVFAALKLQIERRGGLWGRIGDYPYPYRGALCAGATGRGPELEGFIDSFELPTQRTSALEARYRAGLPAVVRGNAARMGSTTELAEQLPLLWSTNLTEFAAWWRARSEIRLSIKQDESTYCVLCDNIPEAGPPVLELWRGKHVAQIPLKTQTTIIEKRRIVYTQETQRGPGGLSAAWMSRGQPQRTDSETHCVPA